MRFIPDCRGHRCLCSDVELELFGRSGVLWYVYYYGIGPFLIHSSAKVLLNPYTQNQVL